MSCHVSIMSYYMSCYVLSKYYSSPHGHVLVYYAGSCTSKFRTTTPLPNTYHVAHHGKYQAWCYCSFVIFYIIGQFRFVVILISNCFIIFDIVGHFLRFIVILISSITGDRPLASDFSEIV